jgi:hypothetical protein
MRVLAFAKNAYKADPSTTLIALFSALVGCWSLVDGEWSSAAIFLALPAIFLVGLWKELEPTNDQAAKWSSRVSFAAALTFLGVGCAAALRRDVFLAALAILAVLVWVYGALMERRRRASGRRKISI